MLPSVLPPRSLSRSSAVHHPLILRQLGLVDFSAFALIGSLSAYLGILDFGIGGGLTRFMSFHHERGEHQRISTFAVFGLFFYVVLGIVLLPLLLAAAPAMARFLRYLPICRHSSQDC
jgi:O-antigen/teichoic acid export membrane protein